MKRKLKVLKTEAQPVTGCVRSEVCGWTMPPGLMPDIPEPETEPDPPFDALDEEGKARLAQWYAAPRLPVPTRRVIQPTITIHAGDISRYNDLKAQGYTTLWSGEGKICMEAPGRKPDA